MKKVVIGMSGGVDSGVAAILLKEQGYEVIGITFKFIDSYDATDAIKVCERLNIEHHVVDYRKEFKEKVIDRFINDYKIGLTPNPCVICNKYVKINFLFEEMLKYNADYIATGHYAKILNNKLYKSVDLNKDQTYFLCEVKKEQLSKLLLPLEGIDKKTVREIASKYGLENANKKDSNDVCFIENSFNEFISSNIEDNVGDIIDIDSNKIMGKHNGLSHYTIGQRRGLNIGGTSDRTFVVGKNVSKNILYISIGDNDSLVSDSCIVEKMNWISDIKVECSAKFRYRQEEVMVNVELLENDEILIKYPSGIKSVTPGQACVLYYGDECLGGGIIKEVRKNNNKLWYL